MTKSWRSAGSSLLIGKALDCTSESSVSHRVGIFQLLRTMLENLAIMLVAGHIADDEQASNRAKRTNHGSAGGTTRSEQR